MRIIAATNRHLPDEIANGRFREDLYYRLNVVSLETPPLRERRADIPALVQFFIGRYAKENGKTIDRDGDAVALQVAGGESREALVVDDQDSNRIGADKACGFSNRRV